MKPDRARDWTRTSPAARPSSASGEAAGSPALFDVSAAADAGPRPSDRGESVQADLVADVRGYDPGADGDLLRRACAFSMAAHASQLRESGDPYFSHPLEVARIIVEMKLDTATVVTALLHDTVEDTLATLEEIGALFGPEIERLVDGVTKLSRLEMPAEQDLQAENFRKLLLATSNDIRVLLVKLADRLHNMRTLEHVRNAEKRRRIALETMEIYAPLAERIGMYNMQMELEDIAFAEINPEARQSVVARLGFLHERGPDLIERITEALQRALADRGLPARISGREKRPYSIWRKMETKNISFEQLSDVMAFRVVVDAVPDCYRALGILHTTYSMVPEHFKDYISTPKLNNYRSLHSTVIGPERQRIELQIRTWEMHEEAELGVAAHWRYKTQGDSRDGPQYRWIRVLLEILENASNPDELFEHTKLEMFRDQVFCFSPRGDLIALPRGATPVDFAYAVHSAVGNSCVGAKINGAIGPLGRVLNNGDQVEILRSSNAAPSPTWLDFVVTGKAKAEIRRFVRNKEKSEYVNLGRAILEKQFRERGHDYSEKALKGALKIGSFARAEDLLEAVGRGETRPAEVVEAIFPGEKGSRLSARRVFALMRSRGKPAKAGDPAVPIKGLIPGMAVHYATCCSPLPGERIVGIVTTGKGVTIHSIDCEALENFAAAPELWLDVSWTADSEAPDVHIGRISTVIANERGSLGDMASLIARNLGNINNLKITQRDPEFFTIVVDIEVQDIKHMSDILAALRASPSIQSVKRLRQ